LPSPEIAALLLVGGALAGFVNTLAGGGSFLTVPLLILAGVEPTAANGTNRVGVLAQSVAALGGFRREGISELSVAVRLLPATLAGSAAGSWLAAHASDALFQRAFALAMLAFLPFVLRPERVPGPAARAPLPVAVQQLAFLAMGVYGGALQAGLGIALLIALVGLAGLDLVRGNAAKVAINAAQQALSLAVFAWAGKVWWATGAILALGQALGGWTASRAGARSGARLIRPLLGAAMLAIALYLFFRV
jgi:uncharacterized membrane protein YfcA